MTATTNTARLYTPEILALAIELAEYPIRASHNRVGEARSRSCGSTIAITLSSDAGERISSVGLRVSACAIGQASAALFARSVVGQTRGDIEQSMEAVGSWLTGDPGQPDWPNLELLNTARTYPARHEAILLPWRAAISALSKD